MKELQLVRLDPGIEASLVGNPLYLEAMMDENWERVADLVHQAVGRKLTVNPVSVDQLEWGGYFAVVGESQEVVGSCAFKGMPSEDGTVEIAYFTYPDFEGQGYATMMAGKLIELAGRCESVVRVIAHTLPEASASTRVLEKVAMQFAGEVTDPEDGRVWRWQRPV